MRRRRVKWRRRRTEMGRGNRTSGEAGAGGNWRNGGQKSGPGDELSGSHRRRGGTRCKTRERTGEGAGRRRKRVRQRRNKQSRDGGAEWGQEGTGRGREADPGGRRSGTEDPGPGAEAPERGLAPAPPAWRPHMVSGIHAEPPYSGG